MSNYVTIWPVLVLALVHFFGTRLRFLGGVPRSIWLSAAGGVAVAYVFLHLFPELDQGQEHVQKVLRGKLTLHHPVYLMALFGLAVFYGLERFAVASRHTGSAKGREEEQPAAVFWVHIASFSVYNALIGYILFQREEGPVRELVLFSVAMALHFIVNDFGLQDHHRGTYRRYGRWILVTALVAGWAVGYLLELPHAVVVLLMAFVGGGVVLNVLKEELPEERESRYWAFLLGTGLYATLLLTL